MKQELLEGKRMQLTIEEDGYYPVKVHASDISELQIKAEKNTDASLLLTYDGTDAASDLMIEAEEGAKLVVLLWDEMKGKWKGTHTICLHQDAQLKLGYGLLNQDEVDLHITAQLMEQGAAVELLSACVCEEKKYMTMDCVHHVPYTFSNMENYCVVKQHGNYFMQANGKIEKGAHGSATHQKTHVLTMSENQKSEVIPLLLIDENDVKASHATTMGQPDENQLYYLQTRGLSRNQALALLTIGYVMPIAEMIDQKELQVWLKEEIEKKVGLHA